MIDKPFRVERCTNPRIGRDYGPTTSWAIVHTGDGTLCTTSDVTFAYRIVELLNRDELRAAGKPPGKRPRRDNLSGSQKERENHV